MLLTLERIDAYLLARLQRSLNVLLLDTLYAQIAEDGTHCLATDLQCADALLAALLANQIVGMWTARKIILFNVFVLFIILFFLLSPIWRILGDTGNDDNSASLVAHNLDGRIGFVFGRRVDAGYGTGRATLAFIAKT